MCMIRESMKFIGYLAFYEQKDRIRAEYLKLTRDDKVLYKYYVYSRRKIRECTCDLIWQFLNNLEPDAADFVTDEILKNECRKYRM